MDHLYSYFWSNQKHSVFNLTLQRVCAKSLQWCLTLCDSLDYSPPGFSVHGILQARILEWLPRPPPGEFPNPGIKPLALMFPALAGGFFTTSTTCDRVALNRGLKSEEDHVQRHRDEKVCSVAEDGKIHGYVKGRVC